MAEPLQDVDPATAQKMIDAGTVTLVDVREDDEWAAGHAPQAVHVPLATLDPAHYTDGSPLVVVCRSGGRSGKAATKLATAGVAVHNLAGGMTAWQNAGQPVLRDDGTPARSSEMSTVAIAIACGVLIGLCLGALGGGGSILTVPVLVSLLHVGPQSATSASLIIVGITSVIAAVTHARGGHVRWKAAAVFGIIGSLTAFGGSILNRAVDPQILLLAFSALMVVAALAMLRRTRKSTPPEPEPDDASTIDATPGGGAGRSPVAVATATTPRVTTAQAGKLVAAALVVGFLTGFLGVGGGFLIVPALVLALGYSMPVAVGTSLVIIAITSAGAFAERIGTATIPWQIVIPFTLAAVAGSFAGTAVSDRISGNALTRSFAILLLVIAVYVATTAGIELAH